jgi:hypothetical protein
MTLVVLYLSIVDIVTKLLAGRFRVRMLEGVRIFSPTTTSVLGPTQHSIQ